MIIREKEQYKYGIWNLSSIKNFICKADEAGFVRVIKKCESKKNTILVRKF